MWSDGDRRLGEGQGVHRGEPLANCGEGPGLIGPHPPAKVPPGSSSYLEYVRSAPVTFDLRATRRLKSFQSRATPLILVLGGVGLLLLEMGYLGREEIQRFFYHPSLSSALSGSVLPFLVFLGIMLAFAIQFGPMMLWEVPEGLEVSQEGISLYRRGRIVKRYAWIGKRMRVLHMDDMRNIRPKNGRSLYILRTRILSSGYADVSTESVPVILGFAQNAGWTLKYPGASRGERWSRGTITLIPPKTGVHYGRGTRSAKVEQPASARPILDQVRGRWGR